MKTKDKDAVREKVRDRVRCSWPSNDLAILYHDREWGVPQHDDRVLFEFLILSGAQAGLSWDTILQKRENYRAALDGFDPKKIARYDQRKIRQLLKKWKTRCIRQPQGDIAVTLFTYRYPMGSKLDVNGDPDKEFSEFKFINPKDPKFIDKLHVPPKYNVLWEYLDET